MTRILGIDPGLLHTGWGLIDIEGSHQRFVACGTISPPASGELATRLLFLNQGLQKIIAQYRPDEAAIEETFVTANGASTLKLGQARGALLLTLGQAGLPTQEYAARLVKKTVTGSGRAEKNQMGMMVKVLLPKALPQSADAADALAVALCHAQHRGLKKILAVS